MKTHFLLTRRGPVGFTRPLVWLLFVSSLLLQHTAQAQCLNYQTPGLYTYTVPAGGPFTIRITTKGGDGASSQGGSGATVIGNFVVQSGDQLTTIVGEAGRTYSDQGGGGGGTAVILNRGGTRSLLAAAGGGGGANAFYNLLGGGGQGTGYSGGGAGGDGNTNNGTGGGGGGGGLDAAGAAGTVGRPGQGGGQASLTAISPGGGSNVDLYNGGSGFGGGGSSSSNSSGGGGGGGGYGGGRGGDARFNSNTTSQGGYSYLSPLATTTTITPGVTASGQQQNGFATLVYPNNTATASITNSNTTLCAGQSTNIIGTINASGTWTITLSDGTTKTGTGSTFSIPVTPPTSTTYTLQCVFDSQGAAQAGNLAGSTAVTINPSPGIIQQPASGSSVCVGTTVTAFVSTTGTVTGYQWYRNGSVVSGQNSATLTLPNTTTAQSGSYRAVVTSSCSSVTSTAFTLTVNPSPTVSITPSATAICTGQSATLQATPGLASYRWSSGQITASISATATGTYTVTATNASSCSATASASVTVNVPPTNASLSSSGTLTCANTSVSLTASATGGVSYTLTGGGSSQSNTSGRFVVSTAGNYTAIIANASGCTTSATTTVQSNTNAPVPTLSASPSTTLTCAQTSLTLTAGGGNAGETLSYTFSPNVVSQSGNMALVNASGIYSVTVTNTSTGCFSTTGITISQDIRAPMASLASSGMLTCAVTSVTLTASPNGQTYIFSPGASPIGSSNQATVSSPGLYSVTVINGGNGCSDVASMSVSQDITPPVATISGNLTVSNGGSTTLTASGGMAQTWSTGETTPSIVVMAGTYSVTVTNASGCSSSTSVTVSLAFGSGALSVLHQDVSFGQTTTNTILPYLQLANSGAAPIAYSAITVRYWLTVEGNSPITNFQNYYVQIGGNNVHEQYVPLATPRQGATAYVEYSFDAAAGNLAGGTNSGPIQNGFSKADYSAFNQSDDYSYVANRDYTANARITAYVNGFLVYGQEPPALGSVTPLLLSLAASPTMLTTSGTTTLSATVSGGTTPYSYSFTGPGTITPSGNTASVSGIPAGVQTYSVVVRDATSPTSQTISGTVSVTVTQAPTNTAPVATANANQTATVGVAFTYTVNAFTDNETPNGLTYTASINPANGFSFDPATRIISGTPSMSGVSSVSITATDPGSLSAGTTFTITVSPAPVVVGNAQLTVLHQDVSFGQTTTNTILPYLQLANSGAAPIAYSAITVRYWLTVEGNSPITNFQNYYVQIGGNNVHEQYVPLATPRQGATAYVEYRFDAAAGNLGGGTNSGPIQNGFSKGDYSAFNQSDDYSYVANRDYVANARITAYVNGVLVYGQEPPVGARLGVQPEVPLSVVMLGNPVRGESAHIEVRGAEGQPLRLQLTDLSGGLVSEQSVERAGAVESQTLSLGQSSAGLLLLRVSTPTQSQTLKVIH